MSWTRPSHGNEQHTMSRHGHGQLVALRSKILSLPEIAHRLRARQSEVRPLHGDSLRSEIAIEEPHRDTAVRKLTRPDFRATALRRAPGCFAERILIDRQHLGIAE